MTAKYTPGPWQLAHPRGMGTAWRVWRNDQGPDAPDDSPNTGYVCVARDIHVTADARLIAHAPEMAEALRDAKAALEACNYDPTSNVMRDVSALLAKLDGDA